MAKTGILMAKRMLRTFRKSFKQFLALLGIGTLAMTLYIGLTSNADSLASRVNEVYTAGNMADIYVTTDAYDADDLNRLKTLASEDSAGSVVEARTELSAIMAGNNSYCVIADSIAEDEMTVSKPIEIFDKAGTTEETFFLMDDALYNQFLETYSAPVSVTFNVSTFLSTFSEDVVENVLTLLGNSVRPGGTNILAQNQLELRLTVTGTMNVPENIANASYNASTFFLSKKLFRQAIKEVIETNYNFVAAILLESYLQLNDDADYHDPSVFPQTNQYLIKMGNNANLEGLEDKIRDYFGEEKESANNNLVSVSDNSTNPWTVSVDSDVKGSIQLCYVFPLVFFLVAILVILTTLSQIIVKDRGDIGTLKAIGVSRGEILGYYIIMTEIILFLASLIGGIAGPMILPMIMSRKYDILYTLPARTFFYFPTLEAIFSTILFMAIGALVTYLVARKELALQPVESMRPKSLTFKKAAKEVKLKANPLSLSVKMAFRNIRVNLVKSLMVIFGVVGCTTLCVCGFGIDDTLNHGIDVEKSTLYSADIMVGYGYEGNFGEALSAVEGVETATQYYMGISTVSSFDEEGNVAISDASAVYLFDEGTTSNLGFELCSDPEEVVISHKISLKYGFSVGDRIQFTYGNNTYDKRVGSIVSLFVSTGVFTYFSSVNQSEPTYSAAWVNCAEGVTDYEEVATTIHDMEFVQSASTQAYTMNRVASVMSGISTMTTAIKVFAILLAAVVLYNLALMNYKDRTRDIATLKVLGFRKREIALSLILETMFLTIIGAILGLVTGYPFMYLTLYVNTIPLADYLYFIQPISYIISFVISFGVGFLVSGWLALMTDQVPMVESLKSVE